MNKIIRSKTEYETALAELGKLMDLDPEPDAPESDRVELLALLIEDYESREFPLELPNPVTAIKFRMEQLELSQSDLVPFLGSRSRVSEVLGGKRSLSLRMIRALHRGLGIPANVLLQDQDPSELKSEEIDWQRFPIREMISRGWIRRPRSDAEADMGGLVEEFFAQLSPRTSLLAVYRRSGDVRSARSMDHYALTAWTARVLLLAKSNPPPARYEPGTVTLAIMRQLARLSCSKSGPLEARSFLREHGISFVVEPHLPSTYLDGAAILLASQEPVIALTLRYDRIDHFWFSLMHELAHVALHGDSDLQFYDDLDFKGGDAREVAADELAGEALIPREAWRKSPASRLRSAEAAQHLADQLNIHPAIVAGRMRHSFGAYKVLNNMVGHGEIRALFAEMD